MKLIDRLFFVLLMLLMTPIASAGLMTFTERALFEDTLGATITDDYSATGYTTGDLSDSFTLDIHSNASMSAVVGETDYQSTGFTSETNFIPNQSADPYYCAGCNGSFILGFTTSSVGDANGVFGAGFNFFNRDETEPYYAFVTFGDSSTQNFLLPIAQFQSPLTGFFGVTSDMHIKSMALGLADGGTTTGGSFGIDNLTIGSARSVVPVPTPATLALFGLGLAALGWTRRKKA